MILASLITVFLCGPSVLWATDLSPLAGAVVNGTLLRLLFDAETDQVSSSCRDALEKLQEGVSGSEEWAIHMVDAAAKIPSGVLEGTVTYLGSYDQCLRTKVEPNSSNVSFVGQYCAVELSPTNQSKEVLILTKIRWDLCVPSSCSPDDINHALSKISDTYAISVQTTGCTIDKAIELDTAQILSVVILSLLGFFLVTGTLYDVIRQILNHLRSQAGKELFKTTQSKWLIGIESFSLYSNACRLFDTSSGGNLSSLNGIRVLSTVWIIVGHSYYYIDWALVGNSKQAVDVRFNFFFQPIMNFSVTVDTFFFMSGLLVVYSNLKKLAKSSHIDWFQFYFHRYWRLTPPVALLIVFLLLWPLMGSGPYWGTATSPVSFCRDNWWANLLYINNFYQLEKPCLEHAWYLATDMQFYILSPLIFYPMWRWPNFGIAANGIFFLVSIITPAVLGVSYKLLPTSLPFSDGLILFETFKRAYVTPYCRMGPYCVGMAVGYILVVKRKVTLSPISQALLWCIAFTCNTSVMYGVYSWNAGQQHAPSLNAFYLAFHRSAWATGIAWLVYACVHGYAGIINRILSWKAFVPLSRLTYVAYLLHVFVLKSFSGLLGDRLVFSQFVWMVIIAGIIMVSFSLSFVVSLCCEVPFQRLERLLWPSHGSSTAILSSRENKSKTEEEVLKVQQGQVNMAFQEPN